MELNSFNMKDIVKMMMKIILEDNEQSVLAKIIHRSKMSAITITPSSHSFQYNKASKTKPRARTLITAKTAFFKATH